MNANERIYVKSFWASTVQDDWEKGETGGECASWNDRELGFRNHPAGYASIEEALKAVCESNSFDYRKEQWIAFGPDYGDEMSRFDGDYLVDVNNSEASKDEIEEWKKGGKKLWNCHLAVNLEIRTSRELTEDEARSF